MNLTANDRKWIKIGGGAVIAFTAYKLIAPKFDKSSNKNDPTGGSDTVREGFDPAPIAKKLFDAMKTTGTDVAKIKSALSGVNEPEFDLVVEEFGNKPYNTSLGNQVALPWFPLPEHDLITWLEEELSASDYEILRIKYPNTL